MKDLPPEVESKLMGASLHDLARSGSDEIVSVIVQLDVPRRKVDIAPVPGKVGRKMSIVDDTSPDELASVSMSVKKELEGLTERPVLELKAARALVADVSGAQLVDVAVNELVRSIRLNTRLDAPGKPITVPE